MRFQWEYVRYTVEDGAEWVAVREHDVCAAGIDKEGLWDAAETVIRAIQAELRQATEPLDRLWAMQLDIAGHLARLALYHLSGDTWQRAKEVEARAAAPNVPLAICLGSSSRERITVRTGSGRTLSLPLGMYGGCLRTFPSNHAAKHWPARWSMSAAASVKRTSARRLSRGSSGGRRGATRRFAAGRRRR